jgi:ribonuclease G
MLSVHPQIKQIRVDDPTLYAGLRSRFGEMVGLERQGFDDILDEALVEATSPVIALPEGGRLGIGSMAALTAIDVDSGGGSAAAANAHAVKQIARQIRLRGLGGQIVVDFIPANGKGGLSNLASQLRRSVADDPVNTAVLGTTPMGLVELTRERRGPSIPELCVETSLEANPLWVGLKALRMAVKEAAFRPGKALRLVVAPQVAQALHMAPQAVIQASQSIGTKLTIRAEKGRNLDDIMIEEGWS